MGMVADLYLKGSKSERGGNRRHVPHASLKGWKHPVCPRFSVPGFPSRGTWPKPPIGCCGRSRATARRSRESSRSSRADKRGRKTSSSKFGQTRDTSGQCEDLGVNAAPDPKCSCRKARRIYGSSTKPTATSKLDGGNHPAKEKAKTTARTKARAKAKTQLRKKHSRRVDSLACANGIDCDRNPQTPEKQKQIIA